MNKLKLLLVLLIPFSVKAACSNQEMTRYKSLASNIDNYYEYSDKFNITIYNLSEELKIVNKNDNSEYRTAGIGEVKINGINPGTSLTLGVYPNNGACSDYRLRTIYINLPYLNKYYQDELCKNNSSVLCYKWTNTNNYTYEQFKEQVKEKKEEEIIPEEEPEEVRYSILEFLGKFYIPILLLIILSGSIGIYYLNKKQKFDF